MGLCWVVANKPVAFLTITLIPEPSVNGIGFQIFTELSALMLASITLIYIQTGSSIFIEYESIVAAALAWIGLAGKISAQLIAATIVNRALVGGRRLARSARRSMLAGTTNLKLKVVDNELIACSGGVHANAKMRIASNRLGKIDLFKARLIIVEVARCLRLAAPGATHPLLWGAAALVLTEYLPRRAGLAR